MGLPDVHSGYGFAIGNMAAFDVNDPHAVVSPGVCVCWIVIYTLLLLLKTGSNFGDFRFFPFLWY